MKYLKAVLIDNRHIKIISEFGDTTTNEVIEWFLEKNISLKRYNVEQHTNCTIHLSNTADKECKAKVVWNRRGKLELLPQSLRNSTFSNYLTKEGFPILEYMEYQWKRKKLL